MQCFLQPHLAKKEPGKGLPKEVAGLGVVGLLLQSVHLNVKNGFRDRGLVLLRQVELALLLKTRASVVWGFSCQEKTRRTCSCWFHTYHFTLTPARMWGSCCTLSRILTPRPHISKIRTRGVRHALVSAGPARERRAIVTAGPVGKWAGVPAERVRWRHALDAQWTSAQSSACRGTLRKSHSPVGALNPSAGA